MVDPSRVDALLQGAAHRQQAGISMHASRMQKLDSKIAQVDKELVTKTRHLLMVEEEADKAHREEIDMKAQCGELVAEVVAYKTENKKLQSSIEEDRQAMSAADEKVQKVKQSFLQSSSQFNADIRKLQEKHPESFFDSGEEGAVPEKAKMPPAKSNGADAFITFQVEGEKDS